MILSTKFMQKSPYRGRKPPSTWGIGFAQNVYSEVLACFARSQLLTYTILFPAQCPPPNALTNDTLLLASKAELWGWGRAQFQRFAPGAIIPRYATAIIIKVQRNPYINTLSGNGEDQEDFTKKN